MTLNTYADGDVLLASQLNNDFKVVSINVNASAKDTTEYSVLATSLNGYGSDLGYSKTFTCPEGANNMIHAVEIEFDHKQDVSTHGMAYFGKLTNDTTGKTIRLGTIPYNNYSGGDTENNYLSIASSNTTYVTTSAICSTNIPTKEAHYNYKDDSRGMNDMSSMIGGETYTLTMYAGRWENGGLNDVTAYVTDITVKVYWSYLQDAVVEGWS